MPRPIYCTGNQARPPSDSEPDPFDQSLARQPEEVPLGDGRVLVLEENLTPLDEIPKSRRQNNPWHGGKEAYALGS